MTIPEDFKSLLPETKIAARPPGEPVYYLWVFDPQEDQVIIEHNEERHPAEHIDHSDLEKRVLHPEKVQGYAYPIEGGYRVTDTKHHAVEDKHIVDLVRRTLDGKRSEHRKGNQSQFRELK